MDPSAPDLPSTSAAPEAGPSACAPAGPAPSADQAPAPRFYRHLEDLPHLVAGMACILVGVAAHVVAVRPKTGGALGWIAGSLVYLAGAGSLGVAVSLLWRRLEGPLRTPRALAAAEWARFRAQPAATGLRWLLFALAGASVAAVGVLPARFSAQVAAGAPDPEATAFLVFARHFPMAALGTYLTGFWLAYEAAFIDFGHAARAYRVATRRRPAAAAIASYAAVGLVGTWLLSLPFCQADVLGASLLTSFFTSFSALTTTGLANVDIAAQFNTAGHAVILLLVLVGGLGIFMLWATISTAARRLSREGAVLGNRELQDPELMTYFRRAGIFFAVAIGAGAVSLFLADTRSQSLGGRLFRSLFHAASAFCNAGFTLDGSTNSFGGSYAYGGLMSVLVVAGGLGPAVVLFPRSTHARAAAVLSGILIVVGAVVFHLVSPKGTHAFVSLYQSVAARTAGFGWVPMDRLSDAASLWLIALMFIGACPGGTGGGVKATLIHTLKRAFLALGRGLSPQDKSVQESAVESMEAFAVVGFSASLGLVGTLVLSALESKPALSLLFEVVSAISTTGLSRDLTPLLSAPSLLVLVVLMIAGKIGPLLLLQALFRSKLGADDFLDRIKNGRVLTV